VNTKELPELLDPNNLPSQEPNEQQLPDKLNEPNEVTVTLTTNEDTLRAMELLFSPNLSELKENQPEMFQYYSLFGAAEGIMRSANLMLYAAPDNPELAKSLMNIAKVIAKTGAEMFEDAKETLQILEEKNQSPELLSEKSKLNSEQVNDIMAEINKIDVTLPDHLK
jgi:hypothetical protein